MLLMRRTRVVGRLPLRAGLLLAGLLLPLVLGPSADAVTLSVAGAPALAGTGPGVVVSVPITYDVSGWTVATDRWGLGYESDLGRAELAISGYWEEEFGARGLTFGHVDLVEYGEGKPAFCIGSPMPTMNARYCPQARFIAVDGAFLRSLDLQWGPVSGFVVLGHEFGHAVQDQLGIWGWSSSDRELQADCLGGAAVGGAYRAGRLVLGQNDWAMLESFLLASGDLPGSAWPGDAHGSGPDRERAFLRGLWYGARACLANW